MIPKRLKSVLKVFLTATLFALVLRLFVLEDFRIVSHSMFPNLLAGDLVFVFKPAYNVRLPFSSYELFKIQAPNKGDVVAFSLSDQIGGTFVKRVIAVGGDTVAIRQGKLVVNELPVTYEPWEPGDNDRLEHGASRSLAWERGIRASGSYRVTAPDGSEKDFGPVDVPAGHFFVLGDNRKESLDSRVWGPIPTSYLKGKVTLIWLSVNENGGVRADRMGKWVI